MVDWTQLSHDLIILIANQLHAVEDFLSFSAVCHSWRCVYLTKSWKPSDIRPWLVLIEDDKSKATSIRRVCTVSGLKIYRIHVHETQGFPCWGSRHGWIMIIDEGLEIFLMNPIARVRMNLPSYSTLECKVDPKFGWIGIIRQSYIYKIQESVVIVMIYGPRSNLAFARRGDGAWRALKSPTPIHFTSVACFEGKIMALSMVGTLYLVEINGDDSPRVLFITSPPADERAWESIYLVESLGNLLMVIFYTRNPGRLIEFKVYKFYSDTRRWASLTDLGDCALLVDGYSCTSVSASDPIKCNNVYYATDNLDGWIMHCKYLMDQYMFVFNIKHKTLEILRFDAGFPARYVCPVWLVPTLG